MFTKACLKDIPQLCDIYLKEIKSHTSYISHGEMQMGIADTNGKILSEAEERWQKYIRRKIMNRQHKYPSLVLKHEKNKKIIAFGVFTVMSDENEKFGVICDMIVRRRYRRQGLGEELLSEGIKWLKSMNIKTAYLESGIKNHMAHAFYETQGFKKTSYVFNLKL